jgi:hypothetical protein
MAKFYQLPVFVNKVLLYCGCLLSPYNGRGEEIPNIMQAEKNKLFLIWALTEKVVHSNLD